MHGLNNTNSHKDNVSHVPNSINPTNYGQNDGSHYFSHAPQQEMSEPNEYKQLVQNKNHSPNDKNSTRLPIDIRRNHSRKRIGSPERVGNEVGEYDNRV